MILFLVVPQSIDNIDLDEILYIKKHGKLSKIYLRSGICHISDQSYKDHLENLCDSFMLIHQSYIVNLKNVIHYYKLGEVKMINHKRLPVSRIKKQEVIQKLKSIN